MTKSRHKAFFAGVWYNKSGQVIVGVVEAGTADEATRQFTGNGRKTEHEGQSMLGITQLPVLQVRSNPVGFVFATTYNRWLRRTTSAGGVTSEPWTKPRPRLIEAGIGRERRHEEELKGLRAEITLQVRQNETKERTITSLQAMNRTQLNTISAQRRQISDLEAELSRQRERNTHLRTTIQATSELLKEI